MLLAEAWIGHEGPLLASLQAVYGLGLRDRSLTVMAAFVAALPPGCALWRSLGGPLAWSNEVRMLNLIEYQLRVANWRKTKAGERGTNPPKLEQPPPYARAMDDEDSKNTAKAEAWRRRQQHS